MSPYCPRCLGVSASGESRCPLDHQFLHRRSCVDCGGELFPREQYCAACGASCREPKESLLVPPEASALKSFLAFALDYLAFGLLIFMTVWELAGAWLFLLGPLVTIFYRALGRSGGRQTFGQAVFHIMTLSASAGPAAFGKALERSVLELWFVPLALFRGAASQRFERKTETLEVTLV